MSSDSINPLADPDFELAPEDVNPPKPEQWPPSEEHWPARPDLKTAVLSRRDSHQALRQFGGR